MLENFDSILKGITDRYPRLDDNVKSFRTDKGKGLPNWNDAVFLPAAAWYAIVSNGQQLGLADTQKVQDINTLMTLYPWRYTKGIYDIDPDLMQHLMDSDISGELPTDVLTNFPQWSLYIPFARDNFQGFFVSLEQDMNDGHYELRFCAHLSDDSLFNLLPLHFGQQQNLDDAVKDMFNFALKALPNLDIDVDNIKLIDLPLQLFSVKLVSVLLYLFSEAPEIINKQEPAAKPAMPMSKKTKKGDKFFPCHKITHWTVGEEMSMSLNAMIDAESKATGKSGAAKATHLRRGHWYGYWYGARGSANREFKFKWLPPTLING